MILTLIVGYFSMFKVVYKNNTINKIKQNAYIEHRIFEKIFQINFRHNTTSFSSALTALINVNA